MEEIFQFIVKLIVPIVMAVIALCSVLKGKLSTAQKRSLEYERISKLSYDLYKNHNDESLKKISEDFGYAAITKDNFLTPEQRKALVKSVEPTKDLEKFLKAKDLVEIHTSPLKPLAFKWKNKKFNSNVKYYISQAIRGFLYFIGGAIASLPLTYDQVMPVYITQRLVKQPDYIVVLLGGYFFALGFGIAYFSLSSGVKLVIAKELIEKHQDGHKN